MSPVDLELERFIVRVIVRLRTASRPCPHGIPQVHVKVAPGIEGPGLVLCDACVANAIRAEHQPGRNRERNVGEGGS